MDVNMLRQRFSKANFFHWNSVSTPFIVMAYFSMLLIETWWEGTLILKCHCMFHLFVLSYNSWKARFIQVSLISGHVVTTISSDREQTTLISNRTYTNGTNQFFSLSLLSSQDVHMLILQTPLEETSVKMDLTETESLLNFTDVFVCGVPYNLVNTSREISNFTGCATLSSGVTLDPLPLNCSFDHQVRPCSHCLNEV